VKIPHRPPGGVVVDLHPIETFEEDVDAKQIVLNESESSDVRHPLQVVFVPPPVHVCALIPMKENTLIIIRIKLVLIVSIV
jgi:hypothetical protein